MDKMRGFCKAMFVNPDSYCVDFLNLPQCGPQTCNRRYLMTIASAAAYYDGDFRQQKQIEDAQGAAQADEAGRRGQHRPTKRGGQHRPTIRYHTPITILHNKVLSVSSNRSQHSTLSRTRQDHYINLDYIHMGKRTTLST